MDAERARALMLCMPHVVETMQWESIVFWVGDKAVGGKMFAVIKLEGDIDRVASYSAGPERYAELLEEEGIFPAPYMARIHWVALSSWGVHRDAVWERELRAAHALTLAKLPPKVRKTLDLPAAELKRAVAERRVALAAKGKKG